MTGSLRLTVHGAASSQLLLRVVNLVAQRGYLPDLLRAEVRGDVMVVRLHLAAHSDMATDAMIERLRSLVEVTAVVAEPRRRA